MIKFNYKNYIRRLKAGALLSLLYFSATFVFFCSKSLYLIKSPITSLMYVFCSFGLDTTKYIYQELNKLEILRNLFSNYSGFNGFNYFVLFFLSFIYFIIGFTLKNKIKKYTFYPILLIYLFFSCVDYDDALNLHKKGIVILNSNFSIRMVEDNKVQNKYKDDKNKDDFESEALFYS